MSATQFKENIQKLNFSFLNEKGESGILLTDAYESLDSKLASPDILFALETAKTKFNVDAVYFRHFNDGRGTIPQVYIYDNTNDLLTNKKKKEIHINVWSGSQVAVYIIIGKSNVKVFDAREKAKDDDENYAKEIIKLTAETLQQFQADDFHDGLFWEEKENEKRFNFEKSAARDLIVGLKKVYNSFQTESGLNSHVALKLLVQCLLIKYLEERDEESKSGYFAVKYFKKNFNCNSFLELIRSGKLLDLLDQLAEDFNGKIFEWNVKNEIEERKAIRKSKVQKLADYLDAKSVGNQFVIWRLYSFSHLPIELISSVYEELLTNSKDIVYTPEMIVSTLVDECMPLSTPNISLKLIDISCGSGIFLVKAYKRIIQWWRYDQWKKTRKLVKPSLETLKELLLTAIHGIDIEDDAIRLSVFSLSLAMLDEVDLNPPTWQKLKFPDLHQNIITKNFFEFVTKNSNSKFDLVIGNPPFNIPFVNGKEPDRKKYFEKLKGDIGYKNDIQIPDENPALHFLTQGMKLLKPEGLLCLIQPSGPILYQRDINFKQALFSQYNLLQIIDFTKLSDILWGRRNVATAAVFIQNSKPDKNDVVHIVVNRTFSNTNRLFLEFDYYDFHKINKDEIFNNLYVWKSNLLGGGRIRILIERLSKLRSLGKLLELKEKNERWVKGEGFIEKGDKNPASYITNKDFLQTDSFSEEGIDWESIQKCKIKYFHRPRRKELYASPHLLIRKIIGKEGMIAEFCDTYLTFTSDIYAIHAPVSSKQELKLLSEYISSNSQMLRFYILSTSSRVKVIKSTSLYDEDILSIPYPENIIDVKLSKPEKLLIEDTFKWFLSADTQSLFEFHAQKNNIIGFSKTFSQTLNSVYQLDNKAFRLFKILETAKYFALHFEYSENFFEPKFEQIEKLEQYIQKIIPTEKGKGKSSHTQRIFKVYGQDKLILAKPKQLRYWIPSIALRDADETFADYLKARYQDAKR